jgi:signal peptidase I
MKKIKKPLRIVGTFLEWFVFGVLIALYAIVLSPNLPTKKYISTYIVSTGSMKPKVEPGSIALIKQTDTKQIKKDDIIIFTSPKDPNQTILHRVFAVKQKGNGVEFETKGDNNNAPDNWTVPESSIKGMYFGTIPLLGHPAAFLKTPKGFLLLFGIPALILVFLQVKKIREGIEEEVQKRVSAAEEKKKKTDILSLIIFFILTGITGLIGVQTVQALFISKATASSITFSVKDFVPPNKPTNLHWNNPNVVCGGTTNSFTITADWDDTTDVGGSGFDHYEYNITYPKIGGGTGNWTTTVKPSQYSGTFNQDNGIHTYKIRAWDKEGNASAWSDTCSITYDSNAPVVSIGSGNNGATPENYTGNGNIPISNTPNNIGPVHGNAYAGTIDIYGTVTDPNLAGWHLRIIKDGTTIDSHSCGDTLGNPENQGYGKCGYLFTMTGTNTKNNQLITTLDTTKLGGDGTYWLILGAIDTLNQRTAGPISIADYWHRDPRIKIIVDNTAPTAILSVTGSPTKIVSENVTNGSFENGLSGWKTTNDVSTKSSETISSATVTPTDGSTMSEVGRVVGPSTNYAWGNRLMQSIPSGARTLSFAYNFFTKDYADDPGMFVRINGIDAFHLSSWMINPTAQPLASTGWQKFVYDISGFTDPYINLTISSGNTGDYTKQSWVYVDDVTTYFVAAPAHAVYTFSGNDQNANYFYRVSPATDFTSYETSGPFTIPQNGSYTLEYYAEDRVGNRSSISNVSIVTDATPPAPASDLTVVDTSTNSATLSWTATGDDGTDGRSSSYDLRYSLTPITEDSFKDATKASTLSSPTLSGENELMQIEGLNPDTTYYFGLKIFDEATNGSPLVTTSTHTTPGAHANPGDVIINELIWKGTSVSVSDEWIELRNMTDRTIDLSNWKLTKYATVSTDTPMYTFPVGTTIKPQGYLMISEFDAAHSALKNEPDLLAGTGSDNTSLFALSDTNLRIRLVMETNTLMDIAWDGSAPPALYHNTGVYNFSMERTNNPGNGEERIRWYPCIDEASKTEFFDGTGIDFGTPGGANRSENEPVIYQSSSATDSATIIEKPTITMSLDQTTHEVRFILDHIKRYTSFTWELSYNTDEKTEGVIGDGIIEKTDSFTKEHILLGTCSTGGTCVYHTGVNNLKLTVILQNSDGEETTIEQTL